MDTNLLYSEDGTTPDISAQLTDATSSISDALGPIIWLSVALTIVFIVLYMSSILRKRKIENAILDIQKTLSEMNARDKARSLPSLPPRNMSEKETIIAQANPSKEVV